MAFKLQNPPYNCDNTPIYRVDMEDGVMGKANNNGTIIINKDLKVKNIQELIWKKEQKTCLGKLKLIKNHERFFKKRLSK